MIHLSFPSQTAQKDIGSKRNFKNCKLNKFFDKCIKDSKTQKSF